jgi:flavin reductase (DIM6/NTAB) family NADH-FMN oxidoreductase RutF
MSTDISTFKKVMSQFATGVTIVTTLFDDAPIGITVNAFCSVSLDPLLVLISVAKPLFTHEQIKHRGVFAINILSQQQVALADRFAGGIPESANRFTGLDWHSAVTGCPILDGSLGWIDCRVYHDYDGGDHTLFVGQVLDAGVNPDGDPLLYFQGHWGQLDRQRPWIGRPWSGSTQNEEAG